MLVHSLVFCGLAICSLLSSVIYPLFTFNAHFQRWKSITKVKVTLVWMRVVVIWTLVGNFKLGTDASQCNIYLAFNNPSCRIGKMDCQIRHFVKYLSKLMPKSNKAKIWYDLIDNRNIMLKIWRQYHEWLQSYIDLKFSKNPLFYVLSSQITRVIDVTLWIWTTV